MPPVHVFVDNSNVFSGAAKAAEAIEPGTPWVAVRVYMRNLFALVERGRPKASAVMVGSVPPGNDALWEYSRGAGYTTDLLKRVDRVDGTTREQGVDEVLHLKVANALLDHDPPQVLVLITGDGAESEFGTGFCKQAERALRRGWQVEVYSWADCLHGEFKRMAAASGGNMRVFELDTWYFSLTFTKGGAYYKEDARGVRTNVTVAERVVQPLPDLSRL